MFRSIFYIVLFYILLACGWFILTDYAEYRLNTQETEITEEIDNEDT